MIEVSDREHMENRSIKSYKDLIVWQKSHKIGLEVFNLFRKTKKDSSTYEIWKQLIRSIFSVPGNIVEGYYSHKGQNFSSKLNVAKGEAGESDYWLFVLCEVDVLSKQKYEELSNKITEVVKMLTGLSNKVKK